MGVTLPQSLDLHPQESRLPDPDFFNGLNSEVQDKGFLVTSTEELFQWARTGSLWWMTFGLACRATILKGLASHRARRHVSPTS
jgi:NADH-quinone oxidoreductase subunit B